MDPSFYYLGGFSNRRKGLNCLKHNMWKHGQDPSFNRIPHTQACSQPYGRVIISVLVWACDPSSLTTLGEPDLWPTWVGHWFGDWKIGGDTASQRATFKLDSLMTCTIYHGLTVTGTGFHIWPPETVCSKWSIWKWPWGASSYLTFPHSHDCRWGQSLSCLSQSKREFYPSCGTLTVINRN